MTDLLLLLLYGMLTQHGRSRSKGSDLLVLKALKEAKILGIRAGSEHRYTGAASFSTGKAKDT